MAIEYIIFTKNEIEKMQQNIPIYSKSTLYDEPTKAYVSEEYYMNLINPGINKEIADE